MNSKELIQSGLLELYALDLCSAEEKIVVEKGMEADEAVRKEYLEICDALDHLAADNAREAPETVKQALFDKIDSLSEKASPVIKPKTPEKTTEEPVYIKPSRTVAESSQNIWRWIAAASVSFMVISSVLAYVYYQRWQDAELQVSVLLQSEMLLTDESGTYKTKLKEMEHKYAFLSNEHLKITTLKAKENYPGTEAVVFWDNRSGEVHLLANALPKLAPGQQYQLWALDNGTPVDAGVIPAEMVKGETFEMKNISSSQAFAITIEKTGGAKSPTLENMVVMGNI